MKISSKVSTMGTTLVLATAVIIISTVFVQKLFLNKRLNAMLVEQGPAEATKLVQIVYQNCLASQARTGRGLEHTLRVARDQLAQAGSLKFATNQIPWQAVNQFTKASQNTTLPQAILNGSPLAQDKSTNTTAPVVDAVKQMTGNFATIFQRMSEDGDMLRISTSVVDDQGQRAIGTFIPRRMADGTENPVLASILKGESYNGRAQVMGQWHAAIYDPLWDAEKKRVVGMLYVGISLEHENQELRNSIMKTVVGKSGYIFVLGSKGDQRGRYIVSKDGKRDGEMIWDSKDASGKFFIQTLVDKGLKTSNGSVALDTYGWKNEGEAKARNKFAALTYYAPWDWVIGAGAYEDDYFDAQVAANKALNHMILWITGVGAIIALVALVLSFFIARGINRPIKAVADMLSAGAEQTVAAAGQVSAASQSLAEGASQQAASLEETSSSLEEMSSMSRRSADNAQSAKSLALETRQAAESGVAHAQTMDQSMKSIQAASENLRTTMDSVRASNDEVTQIVKTIDEIAFQTNILALNAAVEAARAGEAGMGFAVVADEVRNLAQKSAAAARETAEKIQAAVQRSHQGAQVSEQVGEQLKHVMAESDVVRQSLEGISAKAHQVDNLVAEIASAAAEQNQGIQQVNLAVSQMDKVTQANAASAEESASAAEELNSQAESLTEAVHQLVSMVDGKKATQNATAAAPRTAAVRPVKKTTVPSNPAARKNGRPTAPRGAPAAPALVTSASEQRKALPLDPHEF